MSTLHILWNESQLWGLLAVRAASSFGLPFRLVTAAEIAQGLLQSTPPAMLLVPGGNARFKANALGPKGLQAILSYVQKGGNYLGFCGGAGLALTSEGKEPGLGLCPWKRAHFQERLQHFMSGHLHVALSDAPAHTHLIPDTLSSDPLLPVWWPGYFDAEPDSTIQVLASYKKPGPDFWLADLPVAGLPSYIFKSWQDMYGVAISPTFLDEQPALIHGAFGKGTYTLSYSHLETPMSPDANLWLAHLFSHLANLTPTRTLVPAWKMENQPVHWTDAALGHIEDAIAKVVSVGLEYGLLFQRNDWLLGWMTGIPGANINSLLATIRTIRRTHANAASISFWKHEKEAALSAAKIFADAGVEYILTERLAMTLAKTLPDTLPLELLREKRAALFGPPMVAGGLFLELMARLDHLAYLQLSGEHSA